jgi:hypothetical protein
VPPELELEEPEPVPDTEFAPVPVSEPDPEPEPTPELEEEPEPEPEPEPELDPVPVPSRWAQTPAGAQTRPPQQSASLWQPPPKYWQTPFLATPDSTQPPHKAHSEISATRPGKARSLGRGRRRCDVRQLLPHAGDIALVLEQEVQRVPH